MTPTQRAILDFIRAYVKAKGYSPSLRDIADGVGLRSTASVDHHIRTLAFYGYIRRDPGVPRGLAILNPEVPR